MTFTFVTILITSYELLVTTLETDPNVQRNVCKLSHSIDTILGKHLTGLGQYWPKYLSFVMYSYNNSVVQI